MRTRPCAKAASGAWRRSVPRSTCWGRIRCSGSRRRRNNASGRARSKADMPSRHERRLTPAGARSTTGAQPVTGQANRSTRALRDAQTSLAAARPAIAWRKTTPVTAEHAAPARGRSQRGARRRGSLRQELRLLRARYIHVCTVVPATVDTPLFQHAGNYAGRAPRDMPPIVSPERVARAIVRLARTPRREIFVSSAGPELALLSLLAPGSQPSRPSR